MSGDLQIRRERDASDPQVVALVAASDTYLESLYPPESNHAEPLDALLRDDAAFFVGRLDGAAVACGGYLLADGGRYAEIKRVFVDPACRSKRIATRMMRHLEDHLRRQDVSLVRLETGPEQPEAIAFYRKLGYVERGPFGAYRPDPLSVFMEKRLADAARGRRGDTG